MESSAGTISAELKEKLQSERAKARDHHGIESDMVRVVKERDALRQERGELRQLLRAFEDE